MFEPGTDYVGAILDEISLEGLDGITLQGLWLRLSNRPNFGFIIDDQTKSFIWNVVKRMKDVKMYELSDARKPLVIFNRYDYVDQELGMILEPDELPEDIYPYFPVEDKENGIRGSCSTYNTRSDVTALARKLSLEDVDARWGLKLVLVASQTARNIALLSNCVDPLLDITLMQFCILERLGRSRYHGEVTQGKMSLQILGEEPKALFYHRKFLLKHKLVMKQVHHQKAHNGQNCSGSLLHLPRFYVERKPKALFLTQRVVQILKSKPNNIAEYDEIRQQLGLVHSLKKLFKTFNFQQFVRTDMRLPYRQLYPNASVAEWKHKGSDREKTIRTIQLINPNMDEREIWAKQEDLDDEDDDDDECDPEEKGLLNTSNFLMDRTVLSQVYALLEKAGPQGYSQQEIGKKMGMSKLDARTVFRNLLRKGVALTYMQDCGRQRVARIVLKKYEKDSAISMRFAEEKHKMLSFVGNSESVGSGGKRELSPSSKNARTSKKQKLTVSSEFMVENECSDSKDTILSSTESSVQNSQDLTQGSEAPGTLAPPNIAVSVTTVFCDSDSSEVPLNQNPDIDDIESIADYMDESCRDFSDSSLAEELKSSNTSGFMSEIRNFGLSHEPTGITYRLLRRANLIMEAVQVHRVIDDLTKLMKTINDAEDREGYKVKMDKKSLLRILLRLCLDGRLKIFKIFLKGESREKMLYFVCDTSIGPGHATIQSAIEQAKLKFTIPSKEKMTKLKDQEAAEVPKSSLQVSKKELNSAFPSLKKEKFKLHYDPRAGKKYGFSPKFVRMQMFHQFLYYIIYGYEGREHQDQEEALQCLKSSGYEVEEVLRSEMSYIYHPNVGWKMFIPPLPSHSGWPSGWTVMCDVLLRLPLSIFVKIFNVTFDIPQLKEYYLDHPIRQHFLVRHLPLEIRNILMIARKYIFSIHEIAQRLCYIGLVQFGPNRLKEKDQVFLFLNRKATLLNTCTSNPGYHQISDNEYSVQQYEFTTAADVDRYWYNMWDICVHTPLGGRMCVTGKDILLEVLQHKQAMIDASQPRTPEEALTRDIGSVPGDKRGAAGLDSALFSHLKRNWNWSSIGTIGKSKENAEQSQETFEKIRTFRLASVRNPQVHLEMYPSTVNAGAPVFTSYLKRRAPIKRKRKSLSLNISGHPLQKKIKKKHFIRHVLPRKRDIRPRKPYYDEVDKGALKKMNKLRVDWREEEDNLLLLCKVASMYLCPTPRKQTIGFHMTRDILHKFIPASENKTSRACQRRILYMLRSKNTAHSVAMRLEEIVRDPEVSSKFKNCVDKLRSDNLPQQEFDKKLFTKYLALVELLIQKTKADQSHPKQPEFLVPDTIENFRDNFEIVIPNIKFKTDGYFEDVKSVIDIHCAVVNSIIHSSLYSMSGKVSYTYQLFKVYRQYPDNLLRTAISKFRLDRMISLKKRYAHKRFRASHVLPVSSIPYQFSINYSYMLQTKYNFNVFCECFEMLRKMSAWSEEHNLEDNSSQGMEFPLMEGGGSTALFVELLCRNLLTFDIRIPENMIVLDPRLVKEDEQLASIIQVCEKVPSTSELEKFGKSLGIPYKDQNSTPEEKSQSNTQNEESDYDSDEEAVLPNSEEILPANLQTCATRNASRLSLYIKRGNPQDVGSVEIQHAHDFFVVNACDVFCKLNNRVNSDGIKDVFTVDDVKQCLQKLTEKCVVPNKEVSNHEVECRLYDVHKANKDDVETAINLISYVEKKKELGATVGELRDMFHPLFRAVSLASVLSILIDCGMFLRSGVTTVTYIHHSYTKPWVIHTHKVVPDDDVSPCEACGYPFTNNGEADTGQNNGEQSDLYSNEKQNNLEESDRTQSSSENIHKETVGTNVVESERSGNVDIQNVVEMIELDNKATVENIEHTCVTSSVHKRPECLGSHGYFKSSSETIKVAIRPWIQVDGTLNRSPLDRMLSSVLGHSLCNPGINLPKFFDRFSPALQPFHVRELIEILQDLGCVDLYVVKTSWRTTLFSEPSRVTKEKADGTEDESEIIVEPAMDAVFRLGIFIGDKSYTDFPS